MRTIKYTLVLALALLLAAPGYSQVKAGTAGATFLELGVSARGLAMADALLPIADDVSALYYNPAGIRLLEGTRVSFSHNDYFVDTNQEWVGVTHDFPEQMTTVGMSMSYFNSGMMDETTPTKTDGTGREFNYTAMAVGVSAARQLTNKFTVGVTLKYLQQDVMDFSATGWAADVGTYYDTAWRSMRLAMVIQNFGPDMVFYEQEDPLPIVFKFGVGMDLIGKATEDHFLTGAFEFGHPSDNIEYINLGFEYAFKQRFYLRLGKKINGLARDEYSDYVDDTELDPFMEYPLTSTDGLTLGAGFAFASETMGDFRLDFGYAPHEYLEGNNMITLSWWR